jgi:hypothetical protein
MHIAFSSLSTMAARRSVPLIARRTFRLVFRYCREGAEPHTAGGLEQSQRQQYHRQRTRRGNIFSVPRLSDTPVRGVRGESTCHAYSVFVMAEGLCFNRASSKAKSGLLGNSMARAVNSSRATSICISRRAASPNNILAYGLR